MYIASANNLAGVVCAAFACATKVAAGVDAKLCML